MKKVVVVGVGVLTLLEKQHTVTYNQEGSQLFSCCV